MADHSRVFRPATRAAVGEKHNINNAHIPPIHKGESNDSSCNLSTTWIDVETIAAPEKHDGQTIGSQASFESNEERVRGDIIPLLVDDRHFGDPVHVPIAFGKMKNLQEAQLEQYATDQEGAPEHEESSSIPKAEGPYVEIIDTHYETVEGYDWDGILDLRNRMKKEQEEQQQQQKEQHQGVTALQWVTEFRLYLTDGVLEEATEEASLALDDGPRYEVVGDEKNKETSDGNASDGEDKEDSYQNDDDDFVEFVESSKRVHVAAIDSELANNNDTSQLDTTETNEEYASLALSPLDVLTNSLMGTKAFQRNRHHHSVRLTELIVGGPSLKFGESSIERLAKALVCDGGGALRKLVLIVSAVDLTAMNALGECFGATCDSLEDFHFYASQTTERLVGSRSRYKNVPAPSVLGPGISCWVDAWTSNPKNRLRSLNLSRMDIGDEAAFAMSRLLLSAPRLKVLNLAQDDFYASSKTSCTQGKGIGEDNHPPLSFAGTKRVLESLILIEDMKSRARSSSMPLPLSCANLLELDLSGWVLEDDDRQTNSDGYDDDEKAIDNFYDDYNYVEDGSGEEEFEFAGDKVPNSNHNHAARRKNQRACCVIASMLRVNTTLQKLVLVAEDSSADAKPNGLSETDRSRRGLLSVRSTMAIARALRDHVSVPTQGNKVEYRASGGTRRRPLGSNLRTLVLSTNYIRGMTRSKVEDASSWAVTERKRAVAKVFYQALVDRPIHQLRLQELSCTVALKGLEPLGRNALRSANAKKNTSDDNGPSELHSSSKDLRNQLEFFLQRNRRLNQSLKNIDSFWLPRLSSLVDTTNSHATTDDDEDEGFDFVEVMDIDADSTVGAAKNPPPLLVLILPSLLAKAGKEASRHDVVFSCSRILAEKTTLWEMSSEHRCEPPFRYHITSRYK